jgi:hypothetical protein
MLVLAGGILLMQGCKKAEKPRRPREARVQPLKRVDQLSVDWDALAERVRSNSQLQGQLDGFVKRHMQGQETLSTKEALKGTYGVLSARDSRDVAAVSAIELFIRLNVPEIVREGLHHEDWVVLFRAIRFVADRAERGAEDRDVLPYLVYVLEKSIEMPGGSGMKGMQERMTRGIQKITGLDTKTGEIDVDRTEEVKQFLSMVRDWAKANGVKLLD